MRKMLHDIFKPHVCGENNHKFKSIYNNRFTPEFVDQVSRGRFIIDNVESLKELIYLGEVCKFCGKFIKGDRKNDAA